MEKLTEPAAEREPDHVTPASICSNGWHVSRQQPTRPCPTCGDVADYAADQLLDRERVRHFAALADAYTVCGLERATVRWTDDPATPVDCPACTAPTPVEPERRTVSLEVLTDELRAVPQGYSAEPVPSNARVAIVVREAGQPVLIPDTDAPWLQVPTARPVKVLRSLLTEMIAGASRLQREGESVDLLMPTPDVLAALDGRPDATFSTEPPAQSNRTIAAELRALAAIFDAHPDFPVQKFGLSVGQSTDYIGGGDAVRRIGELLGLPVEERVREDGRRSWSVHRYGPLALGWSYIEGDAAVTE